MKVKDLVKALSQAETEGFGDCDVVVNDLHTGILATPFDHIGMKPYEIQNEDKISLKREYLFVIEADLSEPDFEDELNEQLSDDEFVVYPEE